MVCFSGQESQVIDVLLLCLPVCAVTQIEKPIVEFNHALLRRHLFGDFFKLSQKAKSAVFLFGDCYRT